MSEKKSIAIIGGGIAGLSAAYHLDQDFDVTVFEKESKLGGHARTHDFEFNGEKLRIESGFIAFTRKQYPYFSRLLDSLRIPSKKTSMSFAVSNQNTGVVYNATSLDKLFCQRINLLNPKFWRMLIDLIRFYLSAKKIINTLPKTMTVAEYLQQQNFGEMFASDHLVPMISALWTCPPKDVLRFPIVHLVKCLTAHGMMSLCFRPKWEVLSNGSDSYVDALHQTLKCSWHTAQAIKLVERDEHGVTVTCANGLQYHFDAIIFATHADQALTLLSKPSQAEKEILGAMEFQVNHVSIHTDESIMPANKKAWASWNVEVPNNTDQSTIGACVATYWANNLRGLKTNQNIFTSLNRRERIKPDTILFECEYSHPIFTSDLVAAQQRKAEIDGNNRSYFAGAYWGWGFHEDGARTAYEVVQLIKSDFKQNSC